MLVKVVNLVKKQGVQVDHLGLTQHEYTTKRPGRGSKNVQAPPNISTFSTFFTSLNALLNILKRERWVKNVKDVKNVLFLPPGRIS